MEYILPTIILLMMISAIFVRNAIYKDFSNLILWFYMFIETKFKLVFGIIFLIFLAVTVADVLRFEKRENNNG